MNWEAVVSGLTARQACPKHALYERSLVIETQSKQRRARRNIKSKRRIFQVITGEIWRLRESRVRNGIDDLPANSRIWSDA